jgi:predicted Zn-dependent protease
VVAPLRAFVDRGVSEAVVASLEARALAALGRRARGAAVLRRLVERAPAAADGWRSLGEFLLAARRTRSAARALRRAMRLDPSVPETARLLARALARAGRRKEAVAVLARAARHHPLDEEVHVDVAAAHVARGRATVGERALLRGLSWSPESAPLWAACAEMALDDGRLGEARERLRSALRRDPRDPAALACLVRWLIAREQWTRAVHAARAAGRVLPASHPVGRDLGLSLLRAGRPAEAILALRRFVLSHPGDPAAYRYLADAFEGALSSVA